MKTVTMGLIGCGYWGPNLVRNFSSLPECNLKTVCDIKQGRLEHILKEFPFVNVTLDHKDVINDRSIDAVAIATHVTSHFEIAKAAIENKKHVFIEKPMTSAVNEAEQLVKLANKHKVKLAVGHVFQFAPAVRMIKKLLAKKAIGDILHISSTRINMGPPDTEVDVIWDLGPHDFSIILYLLDEFPVDFKCKKNTYPYSFLKKRNSGKDKLSNNAHIDMSFKSGTTAHIHLSWLSANKIRFMQLFGTNGTIVYDEMLALDGKLKLYGKGEDNRLIPGKTDTKLTYKPGEIFILPLEQHEPLRLECEEFINSILKNKKLANDGIIGMNVVKLLQKASECN